MRIEKRFYDLAKAQWDEIEKEVRQEEESRTEAEREIERLKTRKELQEIYRKGEEYASKWKRLPDEKQIQLFHKITEQALWMAESISCNIIVMGAVGAQCPYCEGVISLHIDVGAEIIGGFGGLLGGHQYFIPVQAHFIVFGSVYLIPHSGGLVPADRRGSGKSAVYGRQIHLKN